MKITSIQEGGATNILSWAIKNGLDVKEDGALITLINDQMFYLVNIDDLNLFEVFRLIQMYRDKIRIMGEKPAATPTRRELTTIFPGKIGEGEEEQSLAIAAESTIDQFIKLALQMNTDNDIIQASAARLFLPMISRKVSIQIPVSFADFVNSLSPDEMKEIFNSDYPQTLDKVLGDEVVGFRHMLSLGIVKSTGILRHSKRYDQYLQAIKYAPLKNVKTDKLYKFKIVGFSKYNDRTRSEVRCDMFQADREVMAKSLRQLSDLKTPLKIDFVVQLPIQYMMMILNAFPRDVLEVKYESSMSCIIEQGLNYNDFVMPRYEDDELQDEEVQKDRDNKLNSIEAYKVRIAECNQILMNTITAILSQNEDVNVDVTNTFAMLPSIYNATAVMTLNLDYASKYTSHFDSVISEMMRDMLDMGNAITADINKANQ